MSAQNHTDTIIIGGGFYGLTIALFLYEELGIKDILIIEKGSTTMSRASYVNQARIHNGYHYPRSLLTAHRSHVNFPVFVKDYKGSVKKDFPKYYAVAQHLSKVNAKQFESFVRKIGSAISNAPSGIDRLFNHKLIEKVFLVEEYAFDANKLRDILLERIRKTKTIRLITNEEVINIKQNGSKIQLITNKADYVTSRVLNCTYSQINKLHRTVGLPLVPLKHEITEVCLIELPPQLKDFSVTVMDGPFFSIMPFPATSQHSLTHVRYTPHMSWIDDENTPIEMRNPHEYFKSLSLESNYRQMHADIQRYIPELKDIGYIKSLWEVKTTLLKSETDDSRPILFRSDFGLQGYTCIMGGKLDNIYDVFEELASLYGEKD